MPPTIPGIPATVSRKTILLSQFLMFILSGLYLVKVSKLVLVRLMPANAILSPMVFFSLWVTLMSVRSYWEYTGCAIL